MTITEESRYRLYKRLEGTLGSDDANTLMEHLPQVGWADVATKADLAHFHAVTQAEFATLEAKMSGEFDRRFGEVDQRFVQMGADIDQRFAGVESELGRLRSDLVGLEDRLSMRMDKTLAETLHRQFVQTIASVAALLVVWSALSAVVGQFLVR